jgi:hypothetical protein
MRHLRRDTDRQRCGAASLLTLVLAVLMALTTAPAAQAGTTIPRLPQTNAADWTPRVVNDATRTDAGVYELRQIGSTMYAGGDFTSVQNSTGTTTYPRNRLFSFNATTGAVSTWAPNVNGPVWAMEPSADGRYLYVGGEFTRFDGRAVNRLVKYDLLNGRVDTAFTFPTAIRKVTDLQLVGGRLVVAGTFAGGIVGVNATTGAPDSYFNATQATGQEEGYNTQVYRFSVNPAGTRMVVIGSFTAIGGQPRQQAAMISLGATSASVSGWYSTRWNEDCSRTLRHYTRDVDWSVDGNNFAIVTTGGPAPRSTKLCDTVTWWRNSDLPNQQPVWTNYSGGDTFHSVAVTNAAVFVSGHFRWLDNPEGSDSLGAGGVSRQGIGAISPTTGRALPWNPTKSIEGGRGGYDLYVTGAGLWIGHFEERISREVHPGLGLLPF